MDLNKDDIFKIIALYLDAHSNIDVEDIKTKVYNLDDEEPFLNFIVNGYADNNIPIMLELTEIYVLHMIKWHFKEIKIKEAEFTIEKFDDIKNTNYDPLGKIFIKKYEAT
jgi:hypothetical protein